MLDLGAVGPVYYSRRHSVACVTVVRVDDVVAGDRVDRLNHEKMHRDLLSADCHEIWHLEGIVT